MAQSQDVKLRASIRIGGVVQGVGFRPFVARLARSHDISGFVRNESGCVYMEAVGSEVNLSHFLNDINEHPPKGAKIESLQKEFFTSFTDKDPFYGFFIKESKSDGLSFTMPSPDIAICDNCHAELFEKGNPRFKNPFISCVSCGPRFSVLRELPYDRENTSMEKFPLCDFCEMQYNDAADRRCHAQTVCCNNCGPVLSFMYKNTYWEGNAALDAAITVVKDGGTVAIKGIGGYHFACGPFDNAAVFEAAGAQGARRQALCRDVSHTLRHKNTL